MKFTDYHLLAVFAAVMEERNYTRVAKRLGITQPSVSNNIARLREIYDDPLFIRERTGVRPTSFSMELYPDVAKALSYIDSVSAKNTRFDPSHSKRVFKISAISLFEHTLIPELFRIVEEEAPNITLLIESHSTENISDMLRQGSIDAAIEGIFKTQPFINSHTFYRDELVVVCGKEHPLFSKAKIIKKDFLSNNHITISSLSENKIFFNRFSEQSLKLLEKRNVNRQVASYWGLLSSVKNSKSLALFVRKMTVSSSDFSDLKILENDFLKQKVEAAIYWSNARNVDPSIIWLVEKIKEASARSFLP